ncbi:MAG TPA: iron uptake protein [Limnobacter sp.]|nr:iron uptake protein [Limnobacter sp.]
MSTSVPLRNKAAAILSRIAASLLGGYAFTWGFTSFCIAALVALGVDFHDAEVGVLIAAFLLFLGVFLWAFACESIARAWIVLAGGGGLMTAVAWLVQKSLLS